MNSSSVDALISKINQPKPHDMGIEISKMRQIDSGTIIFFDVACFTDIQAEIGESAAKGALQKLYKTLTYAVDILGGEVYWPYGDVFICTIRKALMESELKILRDGVEKNLRIEMGDDLGMFRLVAGACVKKPIVVFERAVEAAKRKLKFAKRHGRSYAFTTRADFQNKVGSRVELIKAMNRGEFKLYLQPKVSMPSNDICGAECLLRWETKTGDVIAPAQLLPLIKDAGLMNELCVWVVKEAISVLKTLRSKGFTSRLAFNVCAEELLSDGFLSQMRKISYDPELLNGLEVEVTEDKNICTDEVIKRLYELTALGVYVTLDDFGAGYSNYRALASLPFGTFKLDRSFTKDLVENLSSQPVIQNIVEMAAILKKIIVVEGIETIEQSKILESLGVIQGQGYLYEMPIRCADFVTRWLTPNLSLSKAG